VGWLSRPDLETRPGEAGPALPTPEAQCPGRLEARLALFAGLDPLAARGVEHELLAVGAGDAPLHPPETSLLEVSPREIVLSALKPAEDGDGCVLRLSNPTDQARTALVRVAFPVRQATSVRLDETPDEQPLTHDGTSLEIPLGPHALRSVRLS